jgi:hypothetical protein
MLKGEPSKKPAITGGKHNYACGLLIAGFFLYLRVNTEDGGNAFL